MLKEVTVVSCCGKNRGTQESKDYDILAIRLAKSIRLNGGQCKGCDICFLVDSDYPPSEDTLGKLDGYNCNYVYGSVPIEGVHMSLKMAACCLNFNTEYTVWMDTDIYILGDFSGLVSGNTDVMVSPDTRSHHHWTREEDTHIWCQLYNYFGLKTHSTKIITHQDRKPGNFYFSGGLFCFRSSIGFGEEYLDVGRRLLSSGIEQSKYQFDQVALPITISKNMFSYSLIPESLHYFYSIHNHRLEYDNIRVVHYQDMRIKEVSDLDWGV